MCERSVTSLCCIRISGHPVRTLTGRCIRRRPLTGSRAGNNNFECSSREEIDTDTKRTYGGLDEDRGDEPRKERARENGWVKNEREGLRYTLQVRARVSRAANEPAAARFWLHSGLRYINMRLTEWDRCFRVNRRARITSRQPCTPRPIVGPDSPRPSGRLFFVRFLQRVVNLPCIYICLLLNY